MTLLREQADVGYVVPMPTDSVDEASTVTAVTAETLTWLYTSSNAWVSATGQAAGTIVFGKLVYTGILNANFAALGSYNSTSFSLAVATRFSTLKSVPSVIFDQLQVLSPANQTTLISRYLTTNGDYAIDHRRGQIWGISLAVVADDTVAYSIFAPVSGSGGPSANVNVTQVGGVAVPTASGDGVSNTRSDVPTNARIQGFNGTTWDRIRTALVAVQTTFVGILNTISMGRYNATAPTLADGNVAPLQQDSKGNLKTTRAFTAVADNAVSVDQSTALETSTVTKASAGRFIGIYGRVDKTAASGEKWVQVLNAAALPADGAVTILTMVNVTHTTGTNTPFEIDLSEVGGIYGSTGIVVVLSTTEFTKTIDGAYLSTTVLYA